ncbi:GNAT family N-acetyltransferase [Dehalogenimonas etheniformans]|uniref:GNAT family N-acetyltransferase n=1 Tax=Dehalogenimonas etheniformans TaxID=1536648 RepID=A0A2P5P8T0_9CHLR|nr:GNAT family N-acetyltransferase [Dehalogenimonas etheniformans]PPD58701.1 GNAT family N-acetyltransferase [Dehalogenimonas etheniformans]QNT76532.1 GNAT family N-acetyltransferase [Dehalogenimonas etheniformans]
MPTHLESLTIAQLRDNWQGYQQTFKAPHPFVTPEWLEAWWANFRDGDDLFLKEISADGVVLGIAPLRIHGDAARFIGSADVCDYLDFMVKPGTEAHFFDSLLEELNRSNIKTIELESLRPDSLAVKHLLPLVQSRGKSAELTDTDVSLDMPLPAIWDDYLLSLTTHQRHEIGRKMRRLEEAGEIRFDITAPGNVGAELTTLIRLLRISRADKAEFMTGQMESYFRRMAESMNQAGFLRFGHLQMGNEIVASVMCFDYNGIRYLYNSGYDPKYSSLSVGLLSKVYSIKDAIEQKMARYDFLKGAETYKYHLGGIEIPVSRLRIELT